MSLEIINMFLLPLEPQLMCVFRYLIHKNFILKQTIPVTAEEKFHS